MGKKEEDHSRDAQDTSKDAKQNRSTKKDITLPKEEFDSLNQKAKEAGEHYDKWLRCQAELENAKKRLDKEKTEFLKYANEDLIIRMLPTVDNFDRALASVKHTKESDALIEGIRIVQRELHAILNDYGVKAIKSIGEKFDPHYHEAIAVVESDKYPEDTVVEEIQAGYTLNGRLIRPSIVKVCKKGNVKEEDKNG